MKVLCLGNKKKRENLGCGLGGCALLVSGKMNLVMGVIKCFFSGGGAKNEKEGLRKTARDTELASWKKIYSLQLSRGEKREEGPWLG